MYTFMENFTSLKRVNKNINPTNWGPDSRSLWVYSAVLRSEKTSYAHTLSCNVRHADELKYFSLVSVIDVND